MWWRQKWRVSWALPPSRKLLPLYQWIWDHYCLITGQMAHFDCQYLKQGDVEISYFPVQSTGLQSRCVKVNKTR